MVLAGISERRLTKCHRSVFVACSGLCGLRSGRHELVYVRDLGLLQNPLDNRRRIEQVRVLVHQRNDHLGLRHALGFAENVRIRHRNDVRVALKVLAADL